MVGPDDVPALEFSGLYKHFGDNVAVDHIDLRVPAGSFFGLVGPNGAGKTTSLSMAVGLLLALFPALALFIAGQAAHAAALKWLAIPAGLAWAVLLCWRSSRAAAQRLLARGPEIFALARGTGL